MNATIKTALLKESTTTAVSRPCASNLGANVILVDDVLTSGATSDACVRVLKRGGAAKVVVACFARVLEEVAGEVAQNETPGALTPGAP